MLPCFNNFVDIMFGKLQVSHLHISHIEKVSTAMLKSLFRRLFYLSITQFLNLFFSLPSIKIDKLFLFYQELRLPIVLFNFKKRIMKVTSQNFLWVKFPDATRCKITLKPSIDIMGLSKRRKFLCPRDKCWCKMCSSTP